MLREQEVDIAVIGAGPAGSGCAAELAAHGYDVALIDKEDFPRDKACGDGLTPQALAALRKLGLDSLVASAEDIEGCRVVLDHRREHFAGFDEGAPAACLPRSALDNAILEAACERGARFIRARAQGVYFSDDTHTGRVMLAGADAVDGEWALRARRIVAADGSTSVLRRSAGLGTPGHSVRAFAIRGYFATEMALDALFDIYLPIEVHGAMLMGYGWVFRVGEHVANIGVGYFRPKGTGRMPPLNIALDAFLLELMSRERRRFGDIAALTRPSGAPLGLNFQPSCCARGNLLLIGDAAGITDPFTGEGIGLAIEAGVSAAESVHASLVRNVPLTDFGPRMARRLTRSGQDYSSIARVIHQHQTHTQVGAQRLRRLEFLSSALSIAADMNLASEPGDTLTETMLRDLDVPTSKLVTDVHQRLLDTTTTTFPFARALISRQLRARGGPLYAAALALTVRAYEQTVPNETLLLAGETAECIVPFHLFLCEATEHATGELETLNNALAVLAADFVVSRAVLAISRVTMAAAGELARTVCETCEAGMIDASERHDVGRPVERYLLAAEKGMGSALGFAVGLGAELAGSDPDAMRELRNYGRHLGIAQRISRDIAELERVEESKRDFAKSLRFGRYGLPMLLAFERDATLRRLVTAGPARGELDAIADSVRSSGALADARSTAQQHVDAAKSALRLASPPAPTGLDRFADWVIARGC